MLRYLNETNNLLNDLSRIADFAARVVEALITSIVLDATSVYWGNDHPPDADIEKITTP